MLFGEKKHSFNIYGIFVLNKSDLLRLQIFDEISLFALRLILDYSAIQNQSDTTANTLIDTAVDTLLYLPDICKLSLIIMGDFSLDIDCFLAKVKNSAMVKFMTMFICLKLQQYRKRLLNRRCKNSEFADFASL